MSPPGSGGYCTGAVERAGRLPCYRELALIRQAERRNPDSSGVIKVHTGCDARGQYSDCRMRFTFPVRPGLCLQPSQTTPRPYSEGGRDDRDTMLLSPVRSWCCYEMRSCGSTLPSTCLEVLIETQQDPPVPTYMSPAGGNKAILTFPLGQVTNMDEQGPGDPCPQFVLCGKWNYLNRSLFLNILGDPEWPNPLALYIECRICKCKT